MNKIKEALRKFLRADGAIEQCIDGTSISGYDATTLITAIAPCEETHNYWVLRIYPKVSVDCGVSSKCIEQYFRTEDNAIDYLDSKRAIIFEILLYILSIECKELHSTLEDIEEYRKDLDLCDLD